MKQTIEMPQVHRCQVTQCAYNVDSTCHARAITVGNASKHECDTMMQSKSHTKRTDRAGVGACRSRNCDHNLDWECQADSINVNISGGQGVCATYAASKV